MKKNHWKTFLEWSLKSLPLPNSFHIIGKHVYFLIRTEHVYILYNNSTMHFIGALSHLIWFSVSGTQRQYVSTDLFFYHTPGSINDFSKLSKSVRQICQNCASSASLIWLTQICCKLDKSVLTEIHIDLLKTCIDLCNLRWYQGSF